MEVCIRIFKTSIDITNTFKANVNHQQIRPSRRNNNDFVRWAHKMSMGMRNCRVPWKNSTTGMLWLRAIANNKRHRERLCASEVDRKTIHPDVYHDRRWLLWYFPLSQTITMQSGRKPSRPPPAAGPHNLSNQVTRVPLWQHRRQGKAPPQDLVTQRTL